MCVTDSFTYFCISYFDVLRCVPAVRITKQCFGTFTSVKALYSCTVDSACIKSGCSKIPALLNPTLADLKPHIYAFPCYGRPDGINSCFTEWILSVPSDLLQAESR